MLTLPEVLNVSAAVRHTVAESDFIRNLAIKLSSIKLPLDPLSSNIRMSLYSGVQSRMFTLPKDIGTKSTRAFLLGGGELVLLTSRFDSCSSE